MIGESAEESENKLKQFGFCQNSTLYFFSTTDCPKASAVRNGPVGKTVPVKITRIKRRIYSIDKSHLKREKNYENLLLNISNENCFHKIQSIKSQTRSFTTLGPISGPLLDVCAKPCRTTLVAVTAHTNSPSSDHMCTHPFKLISPPV